MKKLFGISKQLLFLGLLLGIAAGSVGYAIWAREATQLDASGDPLPRGARARLGTVRFRQPFIGREKVDPAVQTACISWLRFAPDSKSLMSFDSDRKLQEWDLGTQRANGRLFGEPFGRIEVHQRWTAYDIESNGGLLAYATDSTNSGIRTDPFIHIWDIATGKEVKEIKRSPRDFGESISLRFSPDGKSLAESDSHNTYLRDLSIGDTVGSIEGGAPLAFSPNGKLLATAGWWAGIPGDDGAPMPIRLWDIATKKELHSWNVGDCHQLLFSPDGKALATVDQSVVPARGRILDTVTGKHTMDFKGHDPLAFSPNCRYLACGGTVTRDLKNPGTTTDGAIEIWDVKSGKQVRTISSPQGAVCALAFSPDGQTLASGGADSTILLWEIRGK